jgi:hypothetical protein
MERRSFIGTGLWALLGLGAAATAGMRPLFAREVAVDRRPLDRILRALVVGHEPRVAVRTDAGSAVRYAADPGRVAMVHRRLPAQLLVEAAHNEVSWRYVGRTDPAGLRSPRLLEYASSVASEPYRRDALLDHGGEAARNWFLEHEQQFVQMAAALERQLEFGWSAAGQDLAHRVGQLRGRLDPSRDVEIVPGESYRIRLAGGDGDPPDDRLDLVYDLVRDRFRLTLVVGPAHEARAHLAAHTEVLDLTGNGTHRPGSYRLTRWEDRTVGVVHEPGQASGHPLYARKQDNAVLLVGFFPRFL